MDILFDLPLPEVPVFDMLSNTLSNYFTTACEYRISPLIFAINFCEVGILRFLLENGASSNFADNRGLTPLMHAVKKVRQKENCMSNVNFVVIFTSELHKIYCLIHLLSQVGFEIMLTSCTGSCGLEPWPGQTKQHRIGIMCCGRVTCLFAYLVNYNIILNSIPNQSRVLIHITLSYSHPEYAFYLPLEDKQPSSFIILLI